MRLRIDLAYDGSEFRGWAKQPGLRTVEGELEVALNMILRTPGNRVTVAGRTDTGVHARGQVVHMDLDAETLAKAKTKGKAHGRRSHTEVATLQRRLNGVLDPDLRIHRIVEAPAGFDARFSAEWRRYAYRIADDPVLVDPLRRSHVVSWQRPLDVDAMNEGAMHLIGLNDFAAFCRQREGRTTIRSLIDLDCTRVNGILVANVRADAFCHSMVRSLMGCLIAIGEGREEPVWAAEVMAGRVRPPTVKVAPAHGLTLEEVGYPADSELAARAEDSRRRRTLEDEAE